eukprot:TRINITY_DN37992_c0_g1_i1.p1 TRINITY_DN37992_c0_g1~~TRINITY_DN37992_c0_g1_i1.p1  ORF type:complete len:294 (+),score=75.08 TRINITY_DN37992_c0_g1_i1:38-883(+)
MARSGESARRDREGCGYASIIFGLIFAGLGIHAVVQRNRYTPIFQDVKCESAAGPPDEITKGLLPPSMTIKSVSVNSCTNPNRFPLQVVGGEGTALLVPGMKKIGTVKVRPSVLPPESTGDMVEDLVIRMKGLSGAEEVAEIAREEVSLVLNFTVTSALTVTFLGFQTTHLATKPRVCGFRMHALAKKKGPPDCANTLEDLVIPPIGHDPITQTISMSKARFDRSSRDRDVFFLGIAGVSFVLSLVLLSHGCRAIRGGRRRKGPQEASPLTAEESPSDALE